MSLLQSIVEELDRELHRLQSIRLIVASLSRTPQVVARLVASPSVLSEHETSTISVAPATEIAKPSRRTRADAGQPRGRRTRKPSTLTEPRAFAAANPVGPVVFYPTQLAAEKVRRDQGREAVTTAAPVQTAEDLDALSRSLAARWSTGPVQ